MLQKTKRTGSHGNKFADYELDYLECSPIIISTSFAHERSTKANPQRHEIILLALVISKGGVGPKKSTLPI